MGKSAQICELPACVHYCSCRLWVRFVVLKSGKRDVIVNNEFRNNVERAAEVFEEYADTIRAMIRFHVKNGEEEDVFQTLFLSLVRKPVPRRIKNIRGYLYRAVINDVFDTARRAKTRQNRVYKYARRLKCDPPDQHEQTPTDVAIRQEQKRTVLRFVQDQLPPREGQAVIQRYCLGRTVAEGAKKMGISKRTFSRYACLGLKKIRKISGQQKISFLKSE